MRCSQTFILTKIGRTSRHSDVIYRRTILTWKDSFPQNVWPLDLKGYAKFCGGVTFWSYRGTVGGRGLLGRFFIAFHTPDRAQVSQKRAFGQTSLLPGDQNIIAIQQIILPARSLVGDERASSFVRNSLRARVPLMTCGNLSVDPSPTTYRIWTLSAQPFLRFRKWVCLCTCARAHVHLTPFVETP